jgi:hypothetical protein
MTTLTAPISTQFHAHGAGRSCCRCHKDLTDAASMEAGIGPVCRKQDNALLANSIPANPPEALHAALAIDGASLDPITLPTFQKVIDALATNIAGTDWRKVIKQVEWILSFEANRKVALDAFSNVARSLGYLGLAALWNGAASTGQATVWFANGFVHIDGPRNASARFEFKKIGARFFPATSTPTNGARPTWGILAEKADAFATLIQTHYPMNVGLNDALAQAKAFVAAKPTPAPVTSNPTPTIGGNVKHRIEKRGKTLAVFTPYNADFIAALKLAVPYAYRAWDAPAKCWKVDAQYQNAVADLILQHYKTQPAILNMDALDANVDAVMKHVQHVAAMTPPPVVSASAPVEPKKPVPTVTAAPSFSSENKPVVLPF